MNTSLVLLIGIDALSSRDVRKMPPNVMPTIRGLMQNGAYSLYSRASLRTVSPTGWFTHIHGHGPSSHCWLVDHVQPGCSGLPSIFDVVNSSYAVSTNWKALSNVNSHILNVKTDTDARNAGVATIQARNHKLVFVRFANVDATMHNYNDVGAALKEVDAHVNALINELTIKDHVIIVSDHGYRDCKWYDFMCRDHYGALLRELETPLILYGPTVTPGQLTRRVSMQDTSHYILRMLGLKAPCDWEVGDYTRNCSGSTWPGQRHDIMSIEENLRRHVNIAIYVTASVLILTFALLIYSYTRPIRKTVSYQYVKPAIRRNVAIVL